MGQIEVSAHALDGWEKINWACDDQIICTDKFLNDKKIFLKNSSVSLKYFVDHVENLGTSSHVPDIAWTLGNHHDLSLMGDVGEAVKSSRKLGTALQRLTEGFILLQDASEMRVLISDDMVQISYRILDADIWPRHQDAMFTLGIIYQLIKSAVTDEWEEIEIGFETEDKYVHPILKLGEVTNIIYGADTNYIRIPTHFLNYDIRNENISQSHYQHNNFLSQILKKINTKEFIDRVNELIIRDLNSNKLCQNCIARELGMSSRTLHRKLSIKDKSFQILLDECRSKQAAHMLRMRPNLSITQIALRLGYSDHSSFTRAFCRWAGQSPQIYRKSNIN